MCSGDFTMGVNSNKINRTALGLNSVFTCFKFLVLKFLCLLGTAGAKCG